MLIIDLWEAEATFATALDNKQELFGTLRPIPTGKDLLLFPSVFVQDIES